MYTIESLTRENESYCLDHHIVQSDVDKVNALVEAIETAHKMPHVAPLPGCLAIQSITQTKTANTTAMRSF